MDFALTQEQQALQRRVRLVADEGCTLAADPWEQRVPLRISPGTHGARRPHVYYWWGHSPGITHYHCHLGAG